jgi:hypothetical protein
VERMQTKKQFNVYVVSNYRRRGEKTNGPSRIELN